MKILVAICALLLPAMAWAHPGHGGSGFASGLAHPLGGLDHILGMAAVGIWAARNSGARGWLVVAAFGAGMLAGGLIGLNGVVPGYVEAAVAASALAPALLVALAVRLPMPAQAGAAAFFALWHGIAHGAELPAAASPLAYAEGFLLATGALLATGWTVGKLAGARERRVLGVGMAVLATSLFWA